MNGTGSAQTESAAGNITGTHSGHRIGENNIRFFSLEIHNPVFIVSALLAITLVTATLLLPQHAAGLFADMKSWTSETFGWFYFAVANFLILFCFGLTVSPYGRIRLGGPDAVPQYGYAVWLAMLFAAGVGIGLMFFGVHEPVTHSLSPPLGIDPADTDTARAVGLSTAIMHWGLHGWAIYALVGMTLAFFCFNRGLPLTLRSGFYPLFGQAIWGPFGHAIDILTVLATLFGLAVSLGFGAEQIVGGLQYLFGLPVTGTTKAALIVVITGIALTSVVAGLDKGVKRLSWINMSLAGLLWLFVLITGPTAAILATIAGAPLDYLYYLPALSSWSGREDLNFLFEWPVFYWAWWIAWAPFVGMFIARISYGRTVREFITWVLIVPTVIAVLWMATFGGSALEQYFSGGYTGVAGALPELALFKMLELLPLSGIVSAFSVCLITLFFVTSADSGSLVMDTITAGGKMNAPVQQRVFWCLLAGITAMALMLGGGMASLRALTLAVALPFAVVLLCMSAGLLKALHEELARLD